MCPIVTGIPLLPALFVVYLFLMGKADFQALPPEGLKRIGRIYDEWKEV